MANVLICGDTHHPFCLDGYLEFCKSKVKKYNINKVVHIGDLIDSHYSSFHETDADGLGGKDELELAIKKISKWYRAFPKVTVVIGNHDRMAHRKATTSNVPSAWIREYRDVLKVPNWDFVTRTEIDGVQYVHGEGGTARTRAKNDMMSTVQGHLHTQCYVDWMAGPMKRIFAMQVGCGIDREAYSMAYAKEHKHPFIGCGVVIDGEVPIVFSMPLKNRSK